MRRTPTPPPGYQICGANRTPVPSVDTLQRGRGAAPGTPGRRRPRRPPPRAPPGAPRSSPCCRPGPPPPPALLGDERVGPGRCPDRPAGVISWSSRVPPGLACAPRADPGPSTRIGVVAPAPQQGYPRGHNPTTPPTGDSGPALLGRSVWRSFMGTLSRRPTHPPGGRGVGRGTPAGWGGGPGGGSVRGAGGVGAADGGRGGPRVRRVPPAPQPAARAPASALPCLDPPSRSFPFRALRAPPPPYPPSHWGNSPGDSATPEGFSDLSVPSPRPGARWRRRCRRGGRWPRSGAGSCRATSPGWSPRTASSWPTSPPAPTGRLTTPCRRKGLFLRAGGGSRVGEVHR